MIVQGANISITYAAEKILYQKGILNIPDFIANAGGVICAAMEYQGATESTAMQAIEEQVRRNTRLVLQDAEERAIPPRQAAVELAEAWVRRAMSFRRYSLFSSAPGYV